MHQRQRMSCQYFYSVDSLTFGYHHYLDFRTVEANRVDTCLVNEGGVHCIW